MRRVGAETIEGGENRRRQRIEAATGMLHQLTSFVLWIIAIIAVFNVLQLDAAFFLSSAGFIGAALAIGGQHRVSDYLTGLAVLLEDRFGVGDEIEASVGWEKPVRATVEHVGVITTRLRDGNSTFHVPHSKLDIVRNLSQEPVRESLQIDTSSGDAARVSSTVRNLAGTKGLTTRALHRRNPGRRRGRPRRAERAHHSPAHRCRARVARAEGVRGLVEDE